MSFRCLCVVKHFCASNCTRQYTGTLTDASGQEAITHDFGQRKSVWSRGACNVGDHWRWIPLLGMRQPLITWLRTTASRDLYHDRCHQSCLYTPSPRDDIKHNLLSELPERDAGMNTYTMLCKQRTRWSSTELLLLFSICRGTAHN